MRPQRHGYGILITSFRAHDLSEGELVTMGRDEMLDLEAWYQHLLTLEDVDPNRIGALGESMGATVDIPAMRHRTSESEPLSITAPQPRWKTQLPRPFRATRAFRRSRSHHSSPSGRSRRPALGSATSIPESGLLS
jgi:hypothetical protein